MRVVTAAAVGAGALFSGAQVVLGQMVAPDAGTELLTQFADLKAHDGGELFTPVEQHLESAMMQAGSPEKPVDQFVDAIEEARRRIGASGD